MCYVLKYKLIFRFAAAVMIFRPMIVVTPVLIGMPNTQNVAIVVLYVIDIQIISLQFSNIQVEKLKSLVYLFHIFQ